MSKLQILRERVGEGVERAVAEAAWRAFQDGQPIGQAVAEAIAQVAIDKYRGKIIHALQRAGLPIEDDAVMTVETMKTIISEQSGVVIDNLTPEGVLSALDREASALLSREFGFHVQSVRDPEAILQSARAAFEEAIRTGRATKFITAARIRKIRRIATYVRRGKQFSSRRQILLAQYQKRYRRTHKEIWKTS